MHLLIKQDYLDLEKLNLDGTHSLAKTSGDGIGYQHRKKGRTSNVLILTEGRGIPISIGEIVSGNHSDLYAIVPQFSSMINQLINSFCRNTGIVFKLTTPNGLLGTKISFQKE